MKHQRLYLCLAIALSQLLSAGTLYATTAAKGVFTVAENKTVQFANEKVATREATKNLYQWSEAVAMQEDGWILLSNAEWSYLLADGRTNASDLNSLGTINGENVLIILPDVWVKPEGVPDFSTTYMDDGFGANTYTTEQWTKMAESGAIYLPCGGYGHYDGGFVFDGDETDHGTYWTSTAGTGTKAYCMRFYNGTIHDQNFDPDTTTYRSVILVKEVTVSELYEEHELDDFSTDLTAAKVKDFAIVNRTMYKNGTLHTLCLPFDVPNVDASPLAGAEIFEFKGGTVSGAIGSEVLQLNMSRLTGKGLTQGVPYLLRWAKTSPVETLSTLRFYNVKNWDDDTDAATDPGNTTIKFHGVYSKAHIPGYTSSSEKHYNFFLGANDSIYWPDDATYTEAAGHNMKGFRAYFYIVTAEYPFSAPARQSIQAVWKIDSEVTGYGLPVTGYGLPGTGKLLRDGKVILVIDGKMYDLQGQEIRD